MKLFADLERGLLLSAVLLAIGCLAVCDGGDSGTGAGNDIGNSTGGGTGNDTGVNIASNTCTGAVTCKTVTIGGVVWMAENLNMVAGNSWCYGDSDSYCDKYGRLYDWGTAAAVCPSGWRLPSREDWDSLARSVGGRKHEEEWVEWHYWELAGKKLKSSSGWDTMALTNDTGGLSGEILDGNGTDEFGFSALPGGVRNGSDRNFYSVGSYGAWWTAMGYDSDNAYYRGMEYNEGLGEGYSNVGNGYSVRCVKSEGGSVAPTVYALTASASPITGGAVSFIPDAMSYAPGAQVTVTASAAAGYAFTGWSGAAAGTANPITIVMDGNKAVTANFENNDGVVELPPVVRGNNCTSAATCKKVTIGNQTWMAENLNIETSSGSGCYDNVKSNCVKYGRLYDWNTAMNGASSSNTSPSGVRGVCPAGWHLPSYAEWKELVDFAGGSLTAGTKLKASTGWNEYSDVPVGTDEYGFSALPGGIGSLDGGCGFCGETHIAGYGGIWWTTLGGFDGGVHVFGPSCWVMYYGWEFASSGQLNENYLLSVRCLQD